jgi:hypothetical protein
MYIGSPSRPSAPAEVYAADCGCIRRTATVRDQCIVSPIWIGVFVPAVLAIYVSAYIGGAESVHVVESATTIVGEERTVACYWGEVDPGGWRNVAWQGVFAPIHALDRIVRPACWESSIAPAVRRPRPWRELVRMRHKRPTREEGARVAQEFE